MNLTSFLRLITLSAIWGSSFLFMRLISPTLGPILTTTGRLIFASIFLFIVAKWLKKALLLQQNWRHYLVLALINSAIPFSLFSYASLHLPAGQGAILNSTAPLWGYMIGLLLGNETISRKRIIGLLTAFIGVIVLFSGTEFIINSHVGLAIAAGLAGSCCYGIATNYAKKAPAVPPFLNAYGSMIVASIVMVPIASNFPPIATINLSISLYWLLLGMLCSGIAYLLYFRLISDLGPVSALSVTFLIPVFGNLWGALFLSEPITIATLCGMVIILFGTALVTGFSLSNLRRGKSLKNTHP